MQVDVPKLCSQADGRNVTRTNHLQTKESGPEMLSVYSVQLSTIPGFTSFGKLFCSSDAQKLTEEETEYM